MKSVTNQNALRALIFITRYGENRPISPRAIATKLEVSPTYMAKITSLLVKADILRSFRGAQGGVVLSRTPEKITLLQIFEACHGIIVGGYCQDSDHPLEQACAFHQAMYEVHQSTKQILSRWTLAELATRPGPLSAPAGEVGCLMGKYWP